MFFGTTFFGVPLAYPTFGGLCGMGALCILSGLSALWLGFCLG
jgi:hypothetical protein